MRRSTTSHLQLGQFNILMDKRHVYEWDVRIHLLVRGPGIAPGTALQPIELHNFRELSSMPSSAVPRLASKVPPG